jgi:hypothetical protein
LFLLACGWVGYCFYFHGLSLCFECWWLYKGLSGTRPVPVLAASPSVGIPTNISDDTFINRQILITASNIASHPHFTDCTNSMKSHQISHGNTFRMYWMKINLLPLFSDLQYHRFEVSHK